MKKTPPLLAAIALVVIAVAIPAMHRHQSSSACVSGTRFAMGTVVSIRVPLGRGDDPARLDRAIEAACDEIERVERVFTIRGPDGDIARVNALAADIPVAVSDECYGLIARALALAEETGGAFDVTVGPLTRLWQEAARRDRLPDASALGEARGLTGYRQVALDPVARTVRFRRPGMSLDLGGIAKGYAVDRALAVLRARGIADALIDAGGDLYCLGDRMPRRPWRVGIRHPRKSDRFLCTMRVSNRAVVTSGDYERYAVIGDRRYAHIVDPRNGYPIGDGVVSVTVAASDAVTADAYATALAVVGVDGLALAGKAHVDALIASREDGSVVTRTTDDFEERYAISWKTNG